MHFSSFTDFMIMGGHGPYVWSSYALMLLIIVWNALSAKRQQQQIKQRLTKRLAMPPGTQSTKSSTTELESSQ